MPMNEFDESFTGVCMMFEPSERFEPGGKPRSVWSFARERLQGTSTAFAFVIVTTFLSSILGIVNTAFSRIFIDRLLTGQNPDCVSFILYWRELRSSLIIQIISTIYNLKEGKLAVRKRVLYGICCAFLLNFLPGWLVTLPGGLAELGIASSIIKQFAPIALDFITMVFYRPL